jgi:hypothetical protein
MNVAQMSDGWGEGAVALLGLRELEENGPIQGGGLWKSIPDWILEVLAEFKEASK